jgi:hypothetical protein
MRLCHTAELQCVIPGEIITMASKYARAERIYQLIGRPFNSAYLDRLLMGLGLVITSKDGLDGWIPMLASNEDGVEQIRDIRQGKRQGFTIRQTGLTVQLANGLGKEQGAKRRRASKGKKGEGNEKS